MLRWYQAFSLDWECDAELLVLEKSIRIRVGVVVLLISGDDAYVSDFFIWPTYRRAGAGKILENYACERARFGGARRIQMAVWNADTVAGTAVQENFLRCRGYRVEKNEGECQMVMCGEKDLT
jgi:GNAT superfamily N-acetyltransferase